MGACCALVRLVEGSMRHKALVRAILQVTGYRRAHIKQAGMILPRANGDFTSEFKALVEHFLEKLGCGSIFFPEIVPDYEGWADSWTHGDRYTWVRGKPQGEPTEYGGLPTPSDKDRIREAVMLMFENLRDHGTALDLDDSITLQSCLADGCCEICAGEDYEDLTEDKMLFCDDCHVCRHQSCYKVKIVPEGTFYCRSCTANRNREIGRVMTPWSSKKPATPASLIVDENRFGPLVGSPHQTRSTRSNPFGGFQQFPDPKAAKSKDNPSAAPRKRSASTVQRSCGPSKRQVSRGNRATSHGNALRSTFEHATATFDDIKVVPHLGARLPTPTPSDGRSPSGDICYRTPARSATDESAKSNDMDTASYKVENEASVSIPAPYVDQASVNPSRLAHDQQILSTEQLDKTELRIRLGPKSLINRSLKLSRVDSLDDLFEACINRWKDRLKGETPRILAFLPKHLEGVTEFTPDFQVSDFLSLIKAEWDNGVEKDLFISMILLRDGEDF
ncbi:Protein Jade-1 [Cadophora gregata]|uniref:Protein Jade-1 n=1 Tax=Cadophora gregata TaxID=51156 RepID=UPI0026DCA80D|nr:Protein Jade-1 [Cadophora gregata]KAK0118708.1 Protein Jade-1 [Cadophora gregata f. sp. sojae]KAK0125971.1 Protein Jade-1 [Cadophora gregata]